VTKTDTWQTRHLVRKGAPKRQNSNFESEKISGQMSKIWVWHQDILTNWPSVAMWLWLWLGRLCGLVLTEMFCVSYEVRTEWRCFVFPMKYELNLCYVEESRPPLWSSGQSSWPQIRGSGFNFRRYQTSSGSGTGSTQPREYNWLATWKKKQRLRSRKSRLRA
jgi:hypothetical protein